MHALFERQGRHLFDDKRQVNQGVAVAGGHSRHNTATERAPTAMPALCPLYPAFADLHETCLPR